MRVEDLLYRQRNNSKVAIKCGKEEITYEDWHYHSYLLSKIINKNGTKESLTVTIFLPNSIQYAIAYFGILYSGKVIIPIDIKAKEIELHATLEYCESDIIITNNQYMKYIDNVIMEYTYGVTIINIDTNQVINKYNQKELVPKSKLLIKQGNEDDVTIMLHTSGTLANPKRVMLTHSNLICNVESNIKSLQLSVEDNVLIALPMFFGYCNTAQFLTHIYLGASMVILDTIFFPKIVLKLIQDEKITNFTAVPSMLLMILDYEYLDKYDFSSLRYICFGGGFMPIEKLKLLIQRFHSVGFVQTYGQTECSPRVTALLPQYALDYIGSVGKPIPNVKINIMDKEENILEANQIGEIVVQGQNIMKGYYKQPDITAQTIKNGWLHTGDLGYINDEGFLYLSGRIKNIIISGGINIYPEEIEYTLLQHSKVSEVYVYGQEHSILGEVPVAKVVLKEKVELQELKQYCKKNLAAYKIPVKFIIVNELPKTYNGKLKRIRGE